MENVNVMLAGEENPVTNVSFFKVSEAGGIRRAMKMSGTIT